MMRTFAWPPHNGPGGQLMMMRTAAHCASLARAGQRHRPMFRLPARLPRARTIMIEGQWEAGVTVTLGARAGRLPRLTGSPECKVEA